MPKVGDPIRPGQEIAFIDGDARFGRVVAVATDGTHLIWFRQFRRGDTRYPTGSIRTSNGMGMIPFVDGPDAVTFHEAGPRHARF